jgi:3-phosphoshikimate 1-carboxyvinyltransferase
VRTVHVPADKSITHRALLLAGAASGRSRIENPLGGADCRSTARVLRRLGVLVSPLREGTEAVRITGGWERWRSPAAPLDCGNSGTTARLLMGMLAGRPIRAVLTGDDSLRGRPMRRVMDPLEAAGADLREMEAPDRLPVRVAGALLRSTEHRSAVPSAQVKSAVLLAAVAAGTAATVEEPELSRDHTERMLRTLGLEVHTDIAADGRARISLPANDRPLPPLTMRVPGDPSSAAFLAALPSLLGRGGLRIPGVGVNPTRTGFLDAARRMGAELALEHERAEGSEPVADLVAAPGRLAGVEIGAAEIGRMIDELPVIGVLAARARGETRVTGAAELRVKESDRIALLAMNLRALGGRAEELPDGLVIEGGQAPLRGSVATGHDHRIAMAFGVLGLAPGCAISIDHPESAGISYPGFWQALRAFAPGRAGHTAVATETG